MKTSSKTVFFQQWFTYHSLNKTGILFFLIFCLELEIKGQPDNGYLKKHIKSVLNNSFTQKVRFPNNRYVTVDTLPNYEVNKENHLGKINCNEACSNYHHVNNCNLGIVTGESSDKEFSFLTCACVSDLLILGKGTDVNVVTHKNWCFDVYGCYKSVKGKCLERKNVDDGIFR